MKNDKRTLHMVRCDLVELFDAWENPDTVARVSINLEDVARALIDLGLRMYKSHNTELLQMYFDGAKDALHTFAGVDVEMDIYNNGRRFALEDMGLIDPSGPFRWKSLDILEKQQRLWEGGDQQCK